MRYPRAELRVAGSRTNIAADKEARSEKINTCRIVSLITVKMPLLLWKSKFYYLIHKSQPLVYNQSQMNLARSNCWQLGWL
jgi:hypothetical protein